jgi:hypothetical protein
MRKFQYLLVIQQHFGDGWEDVDEYDKHIPSERKAWKHDVREYRLLGYPTRTINRRVLQ